MTGVDGISGGTYAPTPRPMTDDEADAVSRFLARHPDFTVAWKGNETHVTADVARSKGARLTVSCHSWTSPAELSWGLSEAVKTIVALEPRLPDPAHAIGVRIQQLTVEDRDP